MLAHRNRNVRDPLSHVEVRYYYCMYQVPGTRYEIFDHQSIQILLCLWWISILADLTCSGHLFFFSQHRSVLVLRNLTKLPPPLILMQPLPPHYPCLVPTLLEGVFTFYIYIYIYFYAHSYTLFFLHFNGRGQPKTIFSPLPAARPYPVCTRGQVEFFYLQ